MAYSAKYRVQSISDVYGGITADFEKDGYSGSVTTFEGIAPNPVTIEIGRNTENVFNPILPSRAEVMFYVPDDFEALELATDDPLTWRLSIYDDSSNLIWRGWVEPNQYQEAYTAVPYAVSVIAVDGLEYLKAIDYEIKDDRASLITQLIEALAPTGIALPFRESINIYAAEMASGNGDSPLVQATALYRSYQAINEQPNCFEVLEAILQPFGARIYQWAGHWYLENIYQKSASYIERTINTSGTVTGNATINALKVLDKERPNFRQFIEQSGQLYTLPAIRNARVFFRNIPPTPSTVISGFATADDWTSATALANWTPVNSPTVNQRTISREFDGVFNEFALELTGRQTSLSNDKHIVSGDLAVFQSTFERLDLSFWYQMNWPTVAILGGRPILYVQIELDAGADKYYWRGEWIKNSSVHLRIDPSNRREWKKFETSISSVPDDGDLRVRFFTLVKSGSDSNTWVQIANFNTIVAEQEELDIVYAVDIGTVTGTTIDTYNPYELEVYLADGPNTGRPGALAVGSNVTTAWARRGVTESRELKRMYLLQFLSMHQRPTIKLQGTLKQNGLQIAPFHVVQDNAAVSTRKYVMQQWTVGLNNGEGSVVYRELIEADAAIDFLFRLQDIGPIEINFPIRIGLPGERGTDLIPNIPTFDLDLNGDVSGQPGTNIINPSAIVEKEPLDFTGFSSSQIVVNAVPDSPDTEAMTKTTARDFLFEWDAKAAPVPLDALTISDSEDSDEAKSIKIEDLPIAPSQLLQEGATTGQALVWDGAKYAPATISGSKWTEVTNGIYRNGNVAVGKNTVSTNAMLQVVQNSSTTGLRIETNQNNFNILTMDVFRGNVRLFDIPSIGGFRAFINTGTDLGYLSLGAPSNNTGLAYYNANPGTKRFDCRMNWANDYTEWLHNSASNGTPNTSTHVALQFGVQGIRTNNFTGSTARFWRLGERKAATVALDTTQYITVEVNGVVYNLALVTI